MRRTSLVATAALVLGLAAFVMKPFSAAAQAPGAEPLAPQVAPEPARLVILDYHTFLNSGNSSIDFSLEEFAAQLDAMSGLGYRFVSLEDAVTGRMDGRANLLITIDDGNHSVYEAYEKVMKPRGIKPVLFVYPAVILGGLRYALTKEKLVELYGESCPVGSHGYHHDPVSATALAKDPKDFLIELGKPGPAIARIIGSVPKYYAYPFGVYCAEAERELKDLGYEWAFAADDKVVPLSFLEAGLDHFALPRTIVYRWNKTAVLKELARLLK